MAQYTHWLEADERFMGATRVTSTCFYFLDMDTPVVLQYGLLR